MMNNVINLEYAKTYFDDITRESFVYLIDKYGEQKGDFVTGIYDAMEECGCTSLMEFFKKLQARETSNGIFTDERENASAESACSSNSLQFPAIKRYPSSGIPKSKIISSFETYFADPVLRPILYELAEKEKKNTTVFPIAGSSSSSNNTTAGGVLLLLRSISDKNCQSMLASVIWGINRNAMICSVKNHFIDPLTGENHFIWKDLQRAHLSCQKKCLTLMAIGQPLIIIDNSNSRIKDMLPYVSMAITYNYDVKVIDIPDPSIAINISGNSSSVQQEKSCELEKISEHALISMALENHENADPYCSTRKLEFNSKNCSAKKLLEQLSVLFPFEDKTMLDSKLKKNDNDLNETVLDLIEDGKVFVSEDERENNIDETGCNVS